MAIIHTDQWIGATWGNSRTVNNHTPETSPPPHSPGTSPPPHSPGTSPPPHSPGTSPPPHSPATSPPPHSPGTSPPPHSPGTSPPPHSPGTSPRPTWSVRDTSTPCCPADTSTTRPRDTCRPWSSSTARPAHSWSRSSRSGGPCSRAHSGSGTYRWLRHTSRRSDTTCRSRRTSTGGTWSAWSWCPVYRSSTRSAP